MRGRARRHSTQIACSFGLLTDGYYTEYLSGKLWTDADNQAEKGDRKVVTLEN